MKLRSKIKYKRKITPILKWIKSLFRSPYPRELYRSIIKELHNTNRVRIYMNSYYDVSHSFKHTLEAYHIKHGTEFNVRLLEKLFYITSEMMRFKFEVYKDIMFTTGECEDGLYFEVKFK